MAVKNYHIGDVASGKITGIQAYGLFVSLEDGSQGLIHISEIDNGFVDNVQKKFTLGQQVKVLIIDIDEYTQKMSFSLRALKMNTLINIPVRSKWPKIRKASKIGFKTIKEKMPEWIETSLKDIHSGKVKDYRQEK
ncbi:CvfD/Ygs/GSP13 family RNA-binding post-transcriptional regulator [Aerococcus christensenii]|uniref:Putative general stress protein 13 n=1 Tax=Aerococcus christensenii TaxID=87541 RepID=A0A133Y317_9LACT|nr:CvfD/Ygs/GSP13 family RNA-binding post-transcriptional regulator [Aerococcus christensenii]KXB37546.1 putative general stress protein 13 [Aerococcus christensenii]MDK8233599.1 CvfD/Ygs/GSP13 family RNA-binding post-transcriptional regulator [Aerococcus christensenii]